MKSFAFLLGMLTSLAVAGRTLTVSARNAFLNLKEAVAAARDGDTILVEKGVYPTTAVIINKSITILGNGSPELTGNNKSEILILNGNHIIVKGIWFTHSGYSGVNDLAAIKLVDCHNITISDNQIRDSYFGIHASNSSYFTIINNSLFGRTRSEQTSGNGIHCWKCDHAIIENNQVSGHRDGIYFEFVTYSAIRNNRSISNLRYGLHFMFSHQNNFNGNTFSSNGSGVAIMYSHNVTMMNNRFEKNWGDAAYGILLKEISNSLIIHNIFYKNTIALHLEGTTRMEISNNLFRENGWAAKVQASCSDNNFYHNNFFSNTFDIGTNGTMVLNTFNNNYWDKYDGYDLNRDGVGDVPYHPVSMYSMIAEDNPNALVLLRSFMVSLLDKSEKAIPSLTPENLIDKNPLMKPLHL